MRRMASRVCSTRSEPPTASPWGSAAVVPATDDGLPARTRRHHLTVTHAGAWRRASSPRTGGGGPGESCRRHRLVGEEQRRFDDLDLDHDRLAVSAANHVDACVAERSSEAFARSQSQLGGTALLVARTLGDRSHISAPDHYL